MRAVRLTGPGTLRCEQAAAREPSQGEVLVRTRFASICGSDLHMVYRPAFPLEYPLEPGRPGHEGVGEVVRSEHPELAPGDRVLNVPSPFIAGCFADYQTLPGDACIKLPECDRPLEELLMAQHLGTVVFAMKHLRDSVRGRSVTVLGQGAAGLFFTRLLRRAGAERVFTSDLSPARREVSRQLGAEQSVDAADIQKCVEELTGGEGSDVVIEAVGSRITQSLASSLVRMDGQVLWYGLPDGVGELPFDFATLFRKRATARGAYGAQMEQGLASFREALDLIAAGEVDMTPIVSHILPVEKIQDAMDLAHERRDGAVKVSLSF